MSSANTLIRKLPEAFLPEKAGDLQLTMQFMIDDPMYTVIENGACSVHDGQAEAPGVTLKLKDDDLVKLMTGQLDGVMAFMTGKLKVEGDLMSAQKLTDVFDRDRLG